MQKRHPNYLVIYYQNQVFEIGVKFVKYAKLIFQKKISLYFHSKENFGNANSDRYSWRTFNW
ncbi:hypothetical protein AFL22_22345 [Pantoea sp. CFSAN033090]|nr:hypothetical protein AFL22_22345 [Pantoea sp. CFSAN033090]